ncbi:MAG: right-handed parallel beta-helix repeat-containing protein [Melioribacteraceae bacterium]|nr:right-handed parallel beta-helix repeat-containing protein [Melioribacteraceae bacterium]
MRVKNLLVVLFIIFFSSSIGFSQYSRVAIKSFEEIAKKTNIQNASARFDKTLSLDTFYVPTDYALIQDAIDVSDSGDVVIIEEGTYSQQFNFMGKAITVGSEYFIDEDTSHITKTIIDGSALGDSDSLSLVYLINGEDSTSSLVGLTLTSGKGTFEPQFKSVAGGAIYINNSGATISHNIIEENRIVTDKYAFSGGLNCNLGTSKTLIVSDNIIRNNSVESTSSDRSASGGGLGVYAIGESAKVKISRNKIRHNETKSNNFNIAGGIYFDGNDQPNFQGLVNSNLISHNKVYYRLGVESYGGGMTVVNSNALIENNIIVHNSSHEAAGIDNANLSGKTNPKYVNNTICFNNAIKEEGGISTFHIGEMENCIIWGNKPDQVTPWSQKMKITYSNVEGEYPGEGNINLDPLFCNTEYGVLNKNISPCIDAGNPEISNNDFGQSSPEYPALGSLRNDMGAFGGPHSQWWEDDMQLWEPCANYIFVPTDYEIIQDAIDAAVDGDIIIIEEGTYHQQFNFNGKAVTVGSEFLIDDEISHISKTIIDGSTYANKDTATIVSFISGEDSSSVLCGLTLQNGSGTYVVVPDFHDFRYGGAIEIQNSGATIRKNIIRNCSCISNAWMNSGAAIDCFMMPKDKTIIIEDNVIENNEASGGNRAFGGAIECEGINGNLIIDKNVIRNNFLNGSQITGGAGICILYSNSDNIRLSNNYIYNNSCNSNLTTRAGGIYVVDTKSVKVLNNIIAQNKCLSNTSYGGGIGMGNWKQNSDITTAKTEITNNTLIQNSTKREGGGVALYNIEAVMMNNIIRDNIASIKEQLSFISMPTPPALKFSNIEGGYEGEGNIDVDPQFCDMEFCILTAESSPCIDAGNPDPIYNDMTNEPGDNIIYPAYGTVRNDMGAFGGPHSRWSEMSILPPDPVISDIEHYDIIPVKYSLAQNYPNPFNPITTIKYSIPADLIREAKNVKLSVYDILGREVVKLVDQNQKPGIYEVTWEAGNHPSGVYFYKLKAGDFTKTRKLILLK